MTVNEAKRGFKRHYKRAMHLKEGGKAWEREIGLAKQYLEIATYLYNQNIRAKYVG